MPPEDFNAAQWFYKEVQPHEPSLRNYLRTLAPSTDIDDLVQETYARILRVRDRRELHSPRGFLFATARNAARDLFRRRATAQTSSIDETDCSRIADERPPTPEIVSRRQEEEMLRAAIDALPDRCRTVFVLCKFHRLSHREVAGRLGIAEHTVEAHLTTALRKCAAYFAAHRALPPL